MTRRGRGRTATAPSFLRDERGAAAVEMALVMPLLLLLLFGIIDFGRLLNAQITLTEAAREGSRAASLGHSAQARVTSVMSGLTVSATDVVDCDVDGGTDADAVVTVAHAFRPVTPLGSMTHIFGGPGDGTLTITARGVMPCVG